MAPPATKRRKLSHSSHESSSDGDDSFPSFSSEEHSSSGVQSQDVPSDSGTEDIELDENESDNGSSGSGSGTEIDVEEHNRKEVLAPEKHKVPTKSVERRQNGYASGTTYTGEIFKSNLFKLQVMSFLGKSDHGVATKVLLSKML